MSFADFLRDRAAVANFADWWLELYPLDPSGNPVTLRVSRRGSVSKNSTLTLLVGGGDLGSYTINSNTPYFKRLLTTPAFKQSIWQGARVGGESEPSYGGVTVQNADGSWDQYHPEQGYVWDGQPFRCFYLDRRDPAGTIGIDSCGLMGPPRFHLGTVDIPLLGYEKAAQTPIAPLTRVYRGSSGMLEATAGTGNVLADFGAPAKLNLRTSFSVVGWVWFEALPSADQTLYGYGGSTAGRPWVVRVKSNGAFYASRVIGAALESSTASTNHMVAQRWYHYAAVVSGRDVTLYLWDDEAQVEYVETFVNAFSNATADTATQNVFVQAAASSQIWADEWYVYSRALAAQEVASSRFAPLVDPPVDCVHCLHFDDGAGATVADSAASPASGTLAVTGTGAYTWMWAMEGGPELAGTPKPDCWGPAPDCAPVCVDEVDNVYQVAAGGSIQAVQSKEGGNPHTMDATASSYRSFIRHAMQIDSAVPEGHALPYLARGMFAVYGKPTLTLGADVQGYNNGPGGYADTPVSIVRDVFQQRLGYTYGAGGAIDGSDLDDVSFAAIDAANQQVAYLFVTDPTTFTAKQVADLMMDSVGLGGWGYQRGSSALGVSQFEVPVSADHELTEADVIEFDDNGTSALPVVWQVVVNFAHRAATMAQDALSEIVKGTAAAGPLQLSFQTAERHDMALRKRYPGARSISITIESALLDRTAAEAIAKIVLDTLKGRRTGWTLRVKQIGRQIVTGDGVSLSLVLFGRRRRYALDGTAVYIALTVDDQRQNGTVGLELFK